MSYFSHAFKKTFVPRDVYKNPGAVAIAPAQLNTATAQLGLFTKDGNVSLNSGALNGALAANPDLFYFAQASPYGSDTVGNNPAMGGYQETIKSKILNPKYTSFIGKQAHQAAGTSKGEFIAEHTCFPCGSLYNLRVDMKGSPALRFMSHNMYKIFQSNNFCCTTDEPYIDPTWVLATIADEIRRDDYWSTMVDVQLFTTNTGAATPADEITASATQTFQAQYEASAFYNPEPSELNKGMLRITAAFISTTFGNCSFDPRDYHEMEPLQIQNMQILDDDGDVCTSCGTETITTGTQALGHGEGVLRELILSESYRQFHFPVGSKNASRMREIEQGADLFTAVDRTATNYDAYYVQHHVPRFNNPSGTFDNDQYLLKFAVVNGTSGQTDVDTVMTNLAGWAQTTVKDLSSWTSAT